MECTKRLELREKQKFRGVKDEFRIMKEELKCLSSDLYNSTCNR